MRWNMRKEFEIAYEKADKILKMVGIPRKGMMRTASIIDAVEEVLGIDVKFTDYDFSKLALNSKTLDVSNFGAAMCVYKSDKGKFATILLNNKESTKMKRFSLVHELGHLMTNRSDFSENYQVSTHIDMDITSIPDEVLDETENKFLIDEQVANIFALLVLIPFDLLMYAMRKYDSIGEIADFLGVEKDAVISRFWLEDTRKMING